MVILLSQSLLLLNQANYDTSDSNVLGVEFVHFMSYHLAGYPDPNPDPNSNPNPNPHPNPDPNPNPDPDPDPNPNPKLGRLFHKMFELYLFSNSNTCIL